MIKCVYGYTQVFYEQVCIMAFFKDIFLSLFTFLTVQWLQVCKQYMRMSSKSCKDGYISVKS